MIPSIGTPSIAIPSVTARAASPPPARYWGKRLSVLILVIWAASFVIGFESSLTVLTLVGFGAAIFGLRRPAIGLLGISMLCTLDAPMSHFLFTGGLLRWNTLNYWLLIVILLSVPFLLRLKDPHTRLLQALLVLLGLGLLISTDLMGGIDDLLSIAVLLGLLVYFASASQDEKIWYWLGLVNGLLAAAGGLSFYLAELGIIQVGRLSAINPNAWALFPLTGLFAICLAFPFVAGRRRELMALASLAAVNFVWVFLSGSRGNVLVAIFCLIFLISATRSLLRGAAVLIVLALLGLAVSSQFIDLQSNTMKRIGILLNPEDSLIDRTSGRSDLAIAGWLIFLEYPLGVGTGGFPSAWASLGRLGGQFTYRGVGGLVEAHSAWIKILAENGILGMLLLAAFVLSFAFVGWRRSRQDRNLLALGVLVTVVFSISFISTEYHDKGLWFLAAAVTTLLNKKSISALLQGAAVTSDVHLGVPRRS